jgi:outer membrane lipoprotein SlyB
MKKVFVLIVIVVAFTLMGCSTVNAPHLLGDGTVGPRTGQASGELLFGFFGNVDAGMITAAKNAGITKIGCVDLQIARGLINVTYTTTVTGQ